MSLQKINPQTFKTVEDLSSKMELQPPALFIVPRHVLGGVGYTPPSDQLSTC